MSITKCISHLMVFLFSIMVLYGCMSLSSNDDKAPSEIDVILMADPDINEDVLGIPSPVRLTLLQLSSEIQFRQLPQMASDDKSYETLLGGSMLEQTQVMLRPDELLEFKLPLNEKTKYLGVITAYRDESNDWKSSLQKQEKRWYQVKDNHFLYLYIQPQSVTQLSKQEALSKMLAFKLKEQGKSIEDFEKLTKREQDRVLKKLEKALEKSTPADMSKGYFSSSNSKADAIDVLGEGKNTTSKATAVE